MTAQLAAMARAMTSHQGRGWRWCLSAAPFAGCSAPGELVTSHPQIAAARTGPAVARTWAPAEPVRLRPPSCVHLVPPGRPCVLPIAQDALGEQTMLALL